MSQAASHKPKHDLNSPLYYGEQDENGVDLSLLRYMLSLTPRQRVLYMEDCARQTLELMEYGRRQREKEVHSNS